jgi:hypothetical protein
LPSRHAHCLGSRQRLFGARRDHRPLLFGKRGVDVQDERVDVGPKLSHDESDALGHQARDKGNVAAEPVELGDHDRASELARSV